MVVEAGTEPEDETAAPWYRRPRAWAEAAVIPALTALLIGLLVTACQDDDDADPPPDPTTTLDRQAQAEEDVRQAYRDFLAMVARVSAAPDPSDPGLAEHATGDVRANLEQSLADDLARGIVIRTGPEDEQTILSASVDGDAATLSVCYVGQSAEYDAATGAALAPMQIVTTLDRVDMVRESGSWKVRFVDNAEEDRWAGVHDCDASS
jgi:hypothetical protein